MLPTTVDRVPDNTYESVNEAIRRRTRQSILESVAEGEAAIERRLAELDREWDIERTLEANAAGFSLFGFMMGTFVDRRYYLLPVAVSGFLLEHALLGWCPPLPFFRWMGIRTAEEIEEERYALKALRGDFREIGNGTEQTAERVEHALDTVRR